MRIVDLSHELVTGMQVYPGDPAVSINEVLTVADDGVSVRSVHIGSQSGTHVDAPLHVLGDGLPLDALPLEQFLGPAHVVRALGLAENATIPDACFEGIPPGISKVIVETGWSTHFGSPVYLRHPAPSIDALRHLLDHGVRTIALDVLSLDLTPSPGDEGSFANHWLWSAAGGVICENLNNVASIEVDDPWLSILPIHLGASDGAPVRAVATWG